MMKSAPENHEDNLKPLVTASGGGGATLSKTRILISQPDQHAGVGSTLKEIKSFSRMSIVITGYGTQHAQPSASVPRSHLAFDVAAIISSWQISSGGGSLELSLESIQDFKLQVMKPTGT
jgi:hypothetical protein